MVFSKKGNYDYDTKCECSDDDRCGCTFPDNMSRSFVPDYPIKSSNAVICKPVLVGQQAFNFSAPAVFADGSTNDLFNFFDYITDSYALLIFYLADFSAICPLEITSFKLQDARQTAEKTSNNIFFIGFSSSHSL